MKPEIQRRSVHRGLNDLNLEWRRTWNSFRLSSGSKLRPIPVQTHWLQLRADGRKVPDMNLIRVSARDHQLRAQRREAHPGGTVAEWVFELANAAGPLRVRRSKARSRQVERMRTAHAVKEIKVVRLAKADRS